MTPNHAFEIPNLSLVQVTGADAIRVLSGLCTAKLTDLKAGDASEAMFTDDRGRVLAHAMIALQSDGQSVWIVGQFAAPDKLAAHIDRFIFREDAQPKDVTGQWLGVLLDFHGQDPWNEWAQTRAINPAASCAALNAQPESTAEVKSGWLIRLPITGEEARLLLVPASDVADGYRGLGQWLASLDITLGSAAEFEDRRIRNFWPSIAEMNERTLPQELDRDRRAISFTKGCYLGQETVARLDAMGQVQKKLCLVELYGSTEMVAGQTLLSGDKEVGQLNSVSPVQQAGKRLAMATMRRGFMDPGSQFTIGTGTAGTAATGIVIAHA